MRRCFNAILLKEWRHILRDPKTLVFVLFMPVVLVLLFGYTIRNEIIHTQIAILDYSNGKYAKQLVNYLTASDYFVVSKQLNSMSEVEPVFQKGQARMVVIIPENFDRQLFREKHAKIQLIVDASDLNVSATLVGYAQQIIARFQKNIAAVEIDLTPIDFRMKMQYNPRLESAYMFIPGNIALIMILITSLMTSITLSKERELGSWRMLAITPVNQLVIVLGKIIPYMILSLIDTAIVIVLGILIFAMPMHVRIVLLALLCFLFMFTACSLGVVISVITHTQQVAMLSCMLGFFLPTLLLSDFIFPIENMPIPLQILSHFVPAKWFILAMRDIMIKGAGLELVWLPIAILSGLTLLLMGYSVWKLTKIMKNKR